MKKRYRKPTAKDGELKAVWGKIYSYDTPDLCYAWGKGIYSADSHLIHNVFTAERYGFKMAGEPSKPMLSFLKELEARGYDLTTFKFSIQKKKPANIEHDQSTSKS